MMNVKPNMISGPGLLAGLCVSLYASSAFGLAALAGGATTSCKPTSTNPALRQIQINADPLNVESYQLTMSYNAELLRIVNPDTDVFGLNGFSGVVQTITTQGATGFVTVAGSNSAHPLGHFDVFGAVFTMISDSTPLDTPLEFSVFADTAPPGYVTAYDTDAGDLVTYTPGEIVPSFSGPVSILPEPSVGMVILGIGSGLGCRRRR